jgi:solute carrier family 25 protein 33/36
MIATIITSPLDIGKTRLQSTLNANEGYRKLGNAMPQRNNIMYWIREAGRPVQETMSIVGTIRKNEGMLTLFRGLGPNLAGFVPATALKFLLYGNTKTALVGFTGVENGWTHLSAGMTAGVVTSTAINPIWVIKTRLQLDQSWGPSVGRQSRRYRNSMDCVKETVRQEGFKGLYKGLSASYIGTLETAVQWTLYEYLKTNFRSDDEHVGGVSQSLQEAVSAGSSKLVAAVALYPHEVSQQSSWLCTVLTASRFSEHDSGRHQRKRRPNFKSDCENVSDQSSRKKGSGRFTAGSLRTFLALYPPQRTHKQICITHQVYIPPCTLVYSKLT